MIPQLLQVTTGQLYSFNIRQHRMPNINDTWHYHPEVELIHIKKGSGTQFIGDSITRFKAGDIILVGSCLPHYWKYDSVDGNGNTEVESLVLHFKEDALGEKLFSLPENKVIKAMLEKAKRGLKIEGETRAQVDLLLEKLQFASGPRRIITLLEILSKISNSTELHFLSSMGFKYELENTESDRMAAIYHYSMNNFKRKIELNEIAAVARLSPNSFCRYFKVRTGKTYSQFLTEIKIGHACKLLIEGRINISQLCYECGFNNFGSFHKNFKHITGKSPLSYQKEFTQCVVIGDFQKVA